MPVKINGTTSGSVTLAAPDTGSDVTLSLPGSAGTVATQGYVDSEVGSLALGKVLQVVQSVYSTVTTIATTTYTDTGLTATITPTSSTSKILVLVEQHCSVSRSSTGTAFGLRILRNSTPVYGGDQLYEEQLASTSISSAVLRSKIPRIYLDSPATTSAVTYKTQGAVETTLNSSQAVFQFGNIKSTITLIEVAA